MYKQWLIFQTLHIWAAGLSQKQDNELWAAQRCWYSPAGLHTIQSFKKERGNWHGTLILLWLHRKANLCFCGWIIFPSCTHFSRNGSNSTVSASNKLLSRLNRHLLLTRQCRGSDAEKRRRGVADILACLVIWVTSEWFHQDCQKQVPEPSR